MNLKRPTAAVHKAFDGRRRISAWLMTLGVVAATAGAWVVWGLGIALLVLAGLFVLLSLLVGWE